jgi:hypothetical protein
LHEQPVSAQQERVPAATSAVPRRRLTQRISLGLEQNGTLVVAVAAFAIVLITQLRTALAADGWMALLSGRVVADHGLPSHDMLTIWAHGRTWVDQQWLAQLALYGLERLGGLPLVLLVHVFLVTLALGGAAALACRHGGSARSATWVALPVLVAYWPGAVIMRPQSFAYPLFVAVLWLLLGELRQPSRRVYLVLPLLVLWANLHGSVVVGAAVVSAFAVAEIAASLRSRPRTVHVRSLVLLAAPWVCVLASPYATSLPHYYRLIFSSGFGSYVTEWAPTTLTLAHSPIYVLALGGLWLIGRTGDRATWFEKLTFVGLTLLAFDAVRNAPWLALFSLIVLPRLVDALRTPAVEPKRLNRLLALAMLVLVGVATLGVAVKPDSWFTQGAYPTSAERAAVAAAGAHGRVFANERYADWLVFEDPQLAGRIAYDSRFELLTTRQLQSVQGFRNLVAGWHATVRGYPALVLNRQDDAQPIAALVRTKRARVVTRDGPLVVLRQP